MLPVYYVIIRDDHSFISVSHFFYTGTQTALLSPREVTDD